MSLLSVSWAQWLAKQTVSAAQVEQPLDAVVIGSGYGGAVAALRLAQMGWRVTVLERGSEYRPGDFPNDMGLLPGHVRAPSVDGRSVVGRETGLLEFRLGPGMVSLAGNGLGGGSLVNGGVVMQPDDDVLAQGAWPAEIRSAGAALDVHYQRARAVLGVHSARPMEWVRKAAALRDMAAACEPALTAQPVEFTIDPDRCLRCGDCTTGCNVPGAKLTLRDTYLAQASQAGAQLITSATVHSLRQEGAHWRMRVVATDEIRRFRSQQDAAALTADGAGVDITARLVIVAAGTFGSTELLQRAKAIEGDRLWLSSALGSRLSGNGDSLSFCANQRENVNAVGIGAETWLPHAATTAQQVSNANVGPVITQHVDMRQRADQKSKPAMEHRLVVEDGAVAGAVSRVFAEILATSYAADQLGRWVWNPPRDAGVERLSAGHWLRPAAGQGAARNAASLPQHTQVLLTSGHDGSAGRIVWVAGRDASVPYWEDPAALETYRHQEKVLSAACAAVGGVWVPNPAWRFMPSTVTQMLSGPKPMAFITTVHPLGGCPMGDDPRTSVVDHLGRVWSREDAQQPGDPRVHDNLIVLDGSVVPTSLGCNPLLTITMLAERAMADGHFQRLLNQQGKKNPLSLVKAPAAPQPQPMARQQDPLLPVTMEERFTCDELPGLLAGQKVTADADFKLLSADWLRMWDDPKHRFEVGGRLRLEPVPPGVSAQRTWVSYEVDEAASHAELAAGGWRPAAWRWADHLPVGLRGVLRFVEALWHLLFALVWNWFHLVRTAITWLILRWVIPPADLPERPTLYGWRKPLKTLRNALNLVRAWLHACEVRHMSYEVNFKRSTREPLPAWAQAAPQALHLSGTKRVDYAATWPEIASWAWHAVKRGVALALKRQPRSAQPWPKLRGSFMEQVSHLRGHLTEGAGKPWPAPLRPRARFVMDFKDVVGRLPLRLPAGGDLPSAMAALAAYPLVFGRFALKTRMFDFRLPNYAGRAVCDHASDAELALRPRAGGLPVLPQAVDLTVPLGLSSSDPPEIDPQRALKLRLWRYRRPGGKPEFTEGLWQGQPVRKARSVLLVHAFAQSGYSFTLKSVQQNLAEALYHDGGYEVWVLEHRISTRLPAHREQTTIDQIAEHDIPAAVNEMLARISSEVGEGAPVQVFAFAQCIGAAATAMSLLRGALSHQAARPGSAPAPLMPKLAGLFISQTHPFCIGAPLTQARTWLPAMIRDAFRRERVPFAVRDPQPDMLESAMDRLFAALSIPEAEQCPPRRKGDHDEDDCATCRRLRFIEAPLFKHANLSYETHRELPLLFGDANVRLFAHAAKCVDAERLVSEDGEYVYVNDEQVLRHMGLPICFLHGGANELFDVESAHRSATQYARLHPQWANQVGIAFGAPAAASERAAWVVPGYGHLDVLIAQDAHQRVFPRVWRAFDRWRTTDAAQPEVAVPYAGARLPLTGPLIGAVRRGEQGELRVGVSFQIDDRFSDGKRSEQGPPGTRTWAFARVRLLGQPAQTHSLSITSTPSPNWFAPIAQQKPAHWDALRMAHGELVLSALPPGSLPDLQIECFSVHEALLTPPSLPATDLLPLASALNAAPVAITPALAQWLRQLLIKRRRRVRALALDDRPGRKTASFLRLKPESDRCHQARISAVSLQALAPAPGQAASEVSFAIGSCRYPGFRFERKRVDFSIADFEHAFAATPTAFGLLLGDQIYADRSAGFADELNPTERFVQRHRYAFVRPRAARRGAPALGDWLAHLPVVMTPDDHEFFDGYPDGAPLVKAPPGLMAYASGQAADTARDAVLAFQQRQIEPLLLAPGVWAFSAGPVRVMVLDTRSDRLPSGPAASPNTVLSVGQLAALVTWLGHGDAQQQLNVIATGSVILPGLMPAADPAAPGALDNLQANPNDRDAVLGALAAAHQAHPETFRVLLVSGDYHLCAAAELRREGQPLGACVVAPPLYAPMPFLDTPEQALWWGEPLVAGLSLSNTQAWRGSGLGLLNVQRAAPGGAHCYRVSLRAQLRALEQYGGAPAAQATTLDL